tara:strand:+ start:357 stop:593 length:237 start_codon:yes stop_codon:yes gene_type:complete
MTNYVHKIEEWYIPKRESIPFEVAPCDDCDTYTYCAENETACLDYSRYVNTGKIFYSKRDPSRKIYKRIFKGGTYGRT